MFSLSTTFALSATTCPQCITVVLRVSAQAPKVDMAKSYRPPMTPAVTRVLAPDELPSPLRSTLMVAVASGKGYFPSISFTKYLRKGMRKRIPSTPPSREERNICQKLTSSPRM